MSGWFGGYLGIIDFEIGKNWENLKNFSYSWSEDSRNLDSFIIINPVEYYLDHDIRIINGELYYEYLRKTKNIIKEGGKFKVVKEKEVIDTGWTDFWLTSRSFIIIKKRQARSKAFDIISIAISGHSGIIIPVEFNIDEIFQDYSNQWLGGFRDREGHIHSAQFYGEDIINDDEMGNAYVRTQHKNQVGFLTDYFGTEIKVRITREGYLQIFTNLDDNPDQVFEFIRTELNQYIL